MLQTGKKITAAIFMCGMFFCAGAIANAAEQNPQASQNWSQEQWSEARRIFNESYANMDATRQELAAKREMLNRELANPNPDAGAIEKLSREIGELRGKMLSARATARARLAERGLPADCYGPCGSWYGPRGMMDYYDGGYRGYGWHHGGYHHGGYYGHRGGWGCGGMMWR